MVEKSIVISKEFSTSKGARVAQASKLVMSKTDKIIIFTGLLLVSWAMTWEKSVVYAITPTVTSMFQANNISGVLATVLNILQTALQPMYSKLSDMTGRAEAYTISIVFFVVSYIIMACAQNYDTLIGGQVICAFGFSGTYILGSILIGDMTDIVNRSVFLSLYNFPTIINLFAASAAAQIFLDTGQWRWGYGHVTIVMFVTSAPLIIGLWRIQRKARKEGLLDSQNTVSSNSERTFTQKAVWLVNEIDVLGSMLLMAGLFLILLPLILAPTWGGWSYGVLGPGLMIPARNSRSSDGFIVVSQIIFGAACAFSNYPILVGIQGSVPPEDIAIVIALFEVGVSVAASIGTAIAGSVWNSVLPSLFQKYVPDEYNYLKIVQNIKYALALPEDQYEGVVLAYDDAMRLLGIISVCLGALGFLLSIPLKGFILECNRKTPQMEHTNKTERDHEILEEVQVVTEATNVSSKDGNSKRLANSRY